MYEIIDDYRNSKSDEDKYNITGDFFAAIWASNNKRRVYNKAIKFKVRTDLLNTKVGQVFEAWSEVEYKGYKAMSTENDWCSLIRQKINNLYTRYFDKEVILNRDYMHLLNTPKRLYFQWLDGVEMNADEVTIIIDDAIDKAINLKPMYQKQKMELSWSEYKNVIEGFLYRVFDNCRLIEEYENHSNHFTPYDFMNEDNFYIRYFCKTLEGEMLKYQKRYYGVREHKKYKRCKMCGCLIENDSKNRQYCSQCKVHKRKEINHNYYIKTVLKS